MSTSEHHTMERPPALRALRFVTQAMWAILPESLQLIRDVAARDHAPDFEAVLAKRARQITPDSQSMLRGSTAIVPVQGPIFRYANLFTDLSGATSIEMLAQEFQQAQDHPAVKSIVLWVDSPGGMVNGISEFAAQVKASSKPVVAYVGGMAASAAYWIASAARSIVVSDTAQLGSIGVVSTVFIENDNTVVEIVSSQSPGKRPDVRTEEGRAQLQRNADELAQIFIDTVAANRGVSAEKVMNDFGQGGIVIGRSAVKAGMADRLGALESLIAQLN